jgi:hypothetical protein
MIPIASDDLMEKLFENIRFFAFSSSNVLMKVGGTVSTSILALSAAGLHFYTRLIPIIKSMFVSRGAHKDMAKHHTTMQ